MKKVIAFVFMFVFGFLLVGCNIITTETQTTLSSSNSTLSQTTESTTTTSSTDNVTTGSHADNVVIDLYSINDLHGTANLSLPVLSEMSEYLLDAKAANPYTLILGTGDMFQGTAFSNYYYGLPLMEVFNYVGFSAFTIGNHEFDWGIDKMQNYADGNLENGEANYPFLAANIVYKDTQETLPWTQPYTIQEINGVRIGIIGVIGNVINSISASRVENIEFLDPADTVYKYAEILRTTEDCDVVVASIHDFDDSMNNEIAHFTGDHLVDAIFNGHTHTSISGLIERSGVSLAYAQVSSNLKYHSLIAKISLNYSYTTGKVTAASAAVIGDQVLPNENEYVSNLISLFENEPDYSQFVNQILAYTPTYIYSYELPEWGASVIRDYMQVDIGILNSGGFRYDNDFDEGNITMGELVQTYPFDNYLKTVKITGGDLIDLANSGYDIVFDDHIVHTNGNLYIEGVLMQRSTVYTVAAVDYVFDKDYYPFIYGEDVTQTTTLIRDLLAEDLRNTVGNFSPYNGTSYGIPSPQRFANHYQFYLDIFQNI